MSPAIRKLENIRIFFAFTAFALCLMAQGAPNSDTGIAEPEDLTPNSVAPSKGERNDTGELSTTTSSSEPPETNGTPTAVEVPIQLIESDPFSVPRETSEFSNTQSGSAKARKSSKTKPPAKAKRPDSEKQKLATPPPIKSQFSNSKELVTYTNTADALLNIRTMSVVGIKDNVSDIYAEAIRTRLKEKIHNDLQWSLLEATDSKFGFNEIFDNYEARQLACARANSDALLSGRLIRGVGGMTMTIALLSCRDFKILGLIEERDFQKKDLSEVNEKVSEIYDRLKAQLPYVAMIMSRKGKDVTLNLGSAQGLKVGDELNVGQVISLERHPKLEFITRHEKVILGRISVTKVDGSGSFAKILFEAEPGVIQSGKKVLPKEPVNYGLARTDSGIVDAPGLRGQNQVYGENPQEWLPPRKPQYGSLSFLGGIAQYGNSIDTQSEGALTTNQNLAPNLAFTGEIWLSELWYLFLGTKQSFFSSTNPSASSSPSKLDYYLANYKLGVGYNFLLNDDFWGSKFRAELGFSQFLSVVSENTPVTVTNMHYGGAVLGMVGQLSLAPQFPVTLGARFNYFLTNTVEESGRSSGTYSGTRSYQFGIYGLYPWSERLGLIGQLDFETYKNDFLGPGDRTDAATSASHRLLSILCGINYQF